VTIVPIRRAILSVSDKSGLDILARTLIEAGVELVSTGGTAAYLIRIGIPVKNISLMTGFPEILGGRVKTLHPNVHGGILYRRGNELDESHIAEHGIEPIDLVVVNLYNFGKKLAEGNPTSEELMESIDIGGTTLIRAAAKNWIDVGVVTSPDRYPSIIEEIKSNGGLSLETRKQLAAEAFAHTARYDELISDWFARYVRESATSAEKFPDRLQLNLIRSKSLRYGENPHQSAAFYRLRGEEGIGIEACEQIHGKSISFNNLLDVDIAMILPYEFQEPCVAILKHTTPCGVGLGETIAEAEAKARACDPVSAFGGIIGMNRECDEETAKQIGKTFTEVIVSPGFSEEALKILRKKQNLRLIVAQPAAIKYAGLDIRRVSGGVLLQDRDAGFPELQTLTAVTKREPSETEWAELKFAWIVVKYVKSNAVLFSRAGQTLGIGAGQMSRLDAVQIARKKAMDAQLDLNGSVLASDAFFPFADGLEEAIKAGATAVIQPGGSVRDQEVIDAANKAGIAMVFTGRRHFRHA